MQLRERTFVNYVIRTPKIRRSPISTVTKNRKRTVTENNEEQSSSRENKPKKVPEVKRRVTVIGVTSTASKKNGCLPVEPTPQKSRTKSCARATINLSIENENCVTDKTKNQKPPSVPKASSKSPYPPGSEPSQKRNSIDSLNSSAKSELKTTVGRSRSKSRNSLIAEAPVVSRSSALNARSKKSNNSSTRHSTHSRDIVRLPNTIETPPPRRCSVRIRSKSTMSLDIISSEVSMISNSRRRLPSEAVPKKPNTHTEAVPNLSRRSASAKLSSVTSTEKPQPPTPSRSRSRTRSTIPKKDDVPPLPSRSRSRVCQTIQKDKNVQSPRVARSNSCVTPRVIEKPVAQLQKDLPAVKKSGAKGTPNRSHPEQSRQNQSLKSNANILGKNITEIISKSLSRAVLEKSTKNVSVENRLATSDNIDFEADLEDNEEMDEKSDSEEDSETYESSDEDDDQANSNQKRRRYITNDSIEDYLDEHFFELKFRELLPCRVSNPPREFSEMQNLWLKLSTNVSAENLSSYKNTITRIMTGRMSCLCPVQEMMPNLPSDLVRTHQRLYNLLCQASGAYPFKYHEGSKLVSKHNLTDTSQIGAQIMIECLNNKILPFDIADDTTVLNQIETYVRIRIKDMMQEIVEKLPAGRNTVTVDDLKGTLKAKLLN